MHGLAEWKPHQALYYGRGVWETSDGRVVFETNVRRCEGSWPFTMNNHVFNANLLPEIALFEGLCVQL